jgi:superfamily II DNA/RNA helicase
MSMKDVFKNITNTVSRIGRFGGAKKEGSVMTMMGNKVPKERYRGKN